MSEEETKTSTETDSIGADDKPAATNDQLDVDHYIDGLKEFVLTCKTPMSIALQGEWGIGKTSFMEMIQHKIESDPHRKVFYFNTWQYAQFGTSEDLCFSFAVNLTEKLKTDDAKRIETNGRAVSNPIQAAKNTASNIKDTAFDGFLKACFALFSASTVELKYETPNIKGGTSIDGEKFLAAMQSKKDRAKEIQGLRDNFQKIVNKTLGLKEASSKEDSRIIIFIDDLDRLNPEMAIELLEVIKLFMDVKHCVFVLAVDFDVIEQGVRIKFGKEMTDKKCHDFFDKIIQLPFHMPVESYDVGKLIRETFKKEFSIESNYFWIIEEFSRIALRSNPRAIKRLYNSYVLSNLIWKQIPENQNRHLSGYETAFLFVILGLHMKSETAYHMAYRELQSFQNDSVQNDSGIKTSESENPDENASASSRGADGKDALNNKTYDDQLYEAYEQAFESICDQADVKKSSDLYKKFWDLIRISSVTGSSSSPDSQEAGKSRNVTAIEVSVNGNKIKRQAVNNDVNAVETTFSLILNNVDYNRAIDFVKADAKKDRGRDISFYQDGGFSLKQIKTPGKFRGRNSKPIDLEKSPSEARTRKVYLAAWTGFPAKTKQVEKLCEFMKNAGVPVGVSWFDDKGNTVYSYPPKDTANKQAD